MSTIKHYRGIKPPAWNADRKNIVYTSHLSYMSSLQLETIAGGGTQKNRDQE